MRILKLSAYCSPEQESSSRITIDLYEAYEKAGFFVENYVPMPSRGVSDEVRNEYKNKKTEILNNGHLTIHRFPMFREGQNPLIRAIRYILVNIIQYWKGIHTENIDVIFSGSTPPTQGLLCALVKKNLSKKYGHPVAMIYAIQDIFPDSLVTSGMTQVGSVFWNIGIKITDYAYKNADQIITISESMKHNLESKGVDSSKIHVISNWIDKKTIIPIDKKNNPLFDELNIDRSKFIVLYAGNIGAPQGAQIIIQAAENLKNEQEIQFVVFGGGAEKDVFFTRATLVGNIVIHDLLPVESVSQVYSMGDVALITCKKGVGNSGMPSKIWSIMACNTPIIASFDQNSELAETLKRSKSGICVPPEDPEALSDAIYSFFSMWKAKNYIKAASNSRLYVLKNAEKELCVKKYVDVIKSVVPIQ